MFVTENEGKKKESEGGGKEKEEQKEKRRRGMRKREAEEGGTNGKNCLEIPKKDDLVNSELARQREGVCIRVLGHHHMAGLSKLVRVT